MLRLLAAVESMLRETIARGDTLAPGWRDEICAIARTMVAEEREACAKLCESMADKGGTTKLSRLMARECMAAIRMRSNAKVEADGAGIIAPVAPRTTG